MRNDIDNLLARASRAVPYQEFERDDHRTWIVLDRLLREAASSFEAHEKTSSPFIAGQPPLTDASPDFSRYSSAQVSSGVRLSQVLKGLRGD